tara:strand:- start:143 stop:379 length:237 start_codon:yes stop_codon:yes gene_type:complete
MFKRLLESDTGKIIIAILLGIGLASLFRKACKGKNCLIFRAPEHVDLISGTFKYDKKCYKFKEKSVPCFKNKKKVSFT